ncbi:MAG TPA: hypothetical protein VJV78_15970 [Polyangiales bacterium]|nr:hypothetical protein [Polyangiales bacterium]
MDVILTTDTVLVAGPGLLYRDVAPLPRGTIVRVIDSRNGYLRVQSAVFGQELWVAEEETQPTLTGSTGTVLQLPRNTEAGLDPRPSSQSVTWSWGTRLVGALQVVGGVLEVGLGVGGVAVPSGVTTVGGIILIAHGSDTIIAGFRTLMDGEVAHSYTQTGATWAAGELGASEDAAKGIGIGVDLAAGIGPSIAFSVTRRLAIAGAEKATTKVAVAYLDRGALEMGHNIVGVKLEGKVMAWVHFMGKPAGRNVARHFMEKQAVITELAVSGQGAMRAIQMQETLLKGGVQTWSLLGPNCTTTAVKVLRAGGVVIPAWSMSPGLLQVGVRAGAEVTFFAGGIAATAPDVAGGKH